MYDYRRMTPWQQQRVVEARRQAGRPWHAPPHFNQTEGRYFISAACYEHQPIMQTPERRNEWENALISGMVNLDGARLDGWVVLPNHYHMLVECDLEAIAGWLGRLHNGKVTQWNREDGTPGRKVQHRFTDRCIRSERHYYASLNYLHANPVKHGYVNDASDWPWSSLGQYLEKLGRERLVEWWTKFPVGDYGKGWDDQLAMCLQCAREGIRFNALRRHYKQPAP